MIKESWKRDTLEHVINIMEVEIETARELMDEGDFDSAYQMIREIGTPTFSSLLWDAYEMGVISLEDFVRLLPERSNSE